MAGCPEEVDMRNGLRIVCAAVRAADGDLILGVRHYDEGMHAQIKQQKNPEKFYHRGDEDQGFIDNRGFFQSREEAFTIAFKAGQIMSMMSCPSSRLYSEGLY